MNKKLRYIVTIKPDSTSATPISLVEKGFKTELLALRFIYNFCVKYDVNMRNARIHVHEVCEENVDQKLKDSPWIRGSYNEKSY